ncbi:MAG: GDP-mannose 4,6-dehydratase [Thermanaerothrix sp.]|uniref:GDP-mannose 4,6-dehydratase n=1 Tax=Thermanaerothrix sp. TaxID=2972675 RepID=UPI003C7CDBF3
MNTETIFTGKKILVTGAAGFIGSHLVERLQTLGADVRALVRYTSRGDVGWLSLLPGERKQALEIVFGDLRDPDAVRQAIVGTHIVIHLGALISIPYSYFHPFEVAQVNLMGTLNVLIAARDVGVERVIHTSSSEVYGSAQYIPIDERHPLQGQSPYSASKIGADMLAESFHRTFDLPVVTIRPFNTYGPRQSARAVIPAIITQALTRDTIFLGNLSTRRDFTFVTDTVEGFVRAIVAGGVEGGVFNLGTGYEVSISELCQMILALTGSRARIIQDEQRLRPEKSEVLRLLSDNRRAREVLGWTPKVSLDEGLKETIEWIKGNLGRFKTGQYEI